MAEGGRRQKLAAFLTGTTDEPSEPATEPTPPLRDPVVVRPKKRVARPVSSVQTPAPRTVRSAIATPPALPDHLAPPGVVIVAAVDDDGTEWVLEDDPEADLIVDPRYEEEDRNWVRYRSRWGGFLRLAVLIVLVLWGFTVARGRLEDWVDRQITPEGSLGPTVEFTIHDGETTNGVATALENANIISNSTVFRYWLRCDGDLTWRFLSCSNDRVFHAGDYELRENMSFAAVEELLEGGPIPVVYNTITIPEGLRLNEVIERLLALNPSFRRPQLQAAINNPNLASEFLVPGVANDKRLEGTLFPSTYDIAEADLGDEARFLKRMVDTFDQRFSRLLDDLGRDPVIAELGLSDYQVIVIASLIEEEAKTDVDRPLMARAIYNRLSQDMPLQIDASVYYAAGKAFTEPLFQSDLDSDSPYNTYINTDVPPTPIAAPGEKALRAALAPAAGDWLFWVRTDHDGVIGAHTFSTTLDEHNQAVEVCRRLRYC